MGLSGKVENERAIEAAVGRAYWGGGDIDLDIDDNVDFEQDLYSNLEDDVEDENERAIEAAVGWAYRGGDINFDIDEDEDNGEE
ncbi:hypothetical protein RRF57_013205 [Xylaria bambusicola]|uniref:Uncharacterized protein n=1 Tax=Xylaria bambusicola TaxID=326684 RepID=A0AAN7Z553_9PEZI